MNQKRYATVLLAWLVILLTVTAALTTAQDAPPDCASAALCITIPAGVNVRSLESDTFGEVDKDFPRAEVVVTGWFDAANTPLGAIAGGIWLVLATDSGDLRAVKADLVTQADGASVTREAAALTEQYGYDGSRFLPVRDIPIPTPTPSPTPFPTLDPDDLDFPEVPDELTFHHPIFNSDRRGYDVGDAETITVNPDQLLPLPLGELEADQYPVLAQLAEGDAEATYWLAGDEKRTLHHTYNDNAYPTTLSGIVVDIAKEEGVPNGLKILLRTQTPRGRWYTVIIGIQNVVTTVPVDNALYPISPENRRASFDLKIVFRPDKIITDNATINVGDMVAFRFENAHQFDPYGDGWSLVPREIELGYGLTGGFDAFIKAIDKGDIPSDEAFLSVRISYENVFIVRAD